MWERSTSLDRQPVGYIGTALGWVRVTVGSPAWQPGTGVSVAMAQECLKRQRVVMLECLELWHKRSEDEAGRADGSGWDCRGLMGKYTWISYGLMYLEWKRWMPMVSRGCLSPLTSSSSSASDDSVS